MPRKCLTESCTTELPDDFPYDYCGSCQIKIHSELMMMAGRLKNREKILAVVKIKGFRNYTKEGVERIMAEGGKKLCWFPGCTRDANQRPDGKYLKYCEEHNTPAAMKKASYLRREGKRVALPPKEEERPHKQASRGIPKLGGVRVEVVGPKGKVKEIRIPIRIVLEVVAVEIRDASSD